ncbi:sugar ABC transporter permease [Rathayibacter sp. VKM Ac-2929]|uniref:carbohydrate ABC transporter permease n=1 Tax=Rathayibacter sp. VKM Ac-2929 TaxID=2929480 RepID=UPI001FB48FF8|nr:sugar ABC transporter permease [Rathayibacter sp. VKM Ac-2929]MCJ1675529.1 sugar ABC transporter permease [Rathayibacter sp. VKM Ac-2929]
MTLLLDEEKAQAKRGGLPAAGRPGPRKAGRPGFVWSLPAIIMFAVFALLPLVFAVYLSFTEYNGIRLIAPQWVGLDNWARVLTDTALHRSLVVTVVLVILAVVTQLPVSLLIGVWAAGPQRARAVVAALYFIPLLMSTAAVAVLWASLADPNFGIPALLTPLLGPDNLFSNILGQPASAIGLIAFIYLWGATPLHTLIYQGGARSIPETLYQAAAIDGAGTVRQFFSITVPQLKNTIVTSTILMVVGTFTTFDLILILTRGGPSGATSNLPFFMYDRGISALDFGYGCVVAVIVIAVAAIVSIGMVRATGYDQMQGTQEGL